MEKHFKKWFINLFKNCGKANSTKLSLKKDKVQELNINRLKLQVHDTYKKDEKITTKFKIVDESDVINKAYLHEKVLRINGHLSSLEKDSNEFKIQYNKQSVEILIERAVKTNIQILYDKGLFVNYANAEEVLKIFCVLQGVEVI